MGGGARDEWAGVPVMNGQGGMKYPGEAGAFFARCRAAPLPALY